MRNADLAMYHAKARGRGQVQIFTPALAAQSEDRRLIEQELRRALEHEQFEIYLQPQITALDKRVTAAEALLRWRHPQAMRLPGHFIDRNRVVQGNSVSVRRDLGGRLNIHKNTTYT